MDHTQPENDKNTTRANSGFTCKITMSDEQETFHTWIQHILCFTSSFCVLKHRCNSHKD